MLRISILLIAVSFSMIGNAQHFKYHFNAPADSTFNSYLVVQPDKPIRGIVVRDYSHLPDTSMNSPYEWQRLLLERGFLILYTATTTTFPELYIDDAGPELLDRLVHEVMTTYNIPAHAIFVGGMSSSGTRALRYTQYCNEGKSKYNTKIRGVFAVDSPLDLERFYWSTVHNHDHFKNGMLWESNHMTPHFMRIFKGSADEMPERYREASVYSYKEVNGGNAVHFISTPILFYHEPDIDWWINERGAHYLDINSFDIAGFVNQLRLLGNDQVRLETTSNKGFDREGNHKCHSWTIVDENQLVNWIDDMTNDR